MITKTTIKPTAFEELADIVLDDDRTELPKDYDEFMNANLELYDKIEKQLNITDPGYWRTRKEIAWNNYAMAVIEEKLYNIACRELGVQ